MHRTVVATALLLAAMLALPADLGGPGSASAQDPPPACLEREHEDPSVASRDPQTFEHGDGWQATQRTVIRGDTGGAPLGRIAVTSFAGDLVVRHASEGIDRGPREYVLVVDAQARADTEQQARQRLASMEISHDDALEDERLELRTQVHAPSDSGSAGADVTAILPAGPLFALDLSTGAGGIDVQGAFPRIQASTDAGDVGVDVDAWATGRLSLTSDAGDVNVDLAGTSENGFDIEGETDTGDVTLDLPGGQPVGPQTDEHRRARTPDYGNRTPATRLVALTDVGSVGIDVTQQGYEHGPFCLSADQTAEGAAYGPGGPEGTGDATVGVLVGVGALAGLALVWTRLGDRIKILLLGLYTRLTKRDILEHEARQRILDVVEDEPGVHFRELARRLEMGHGILDHHLRKLLEANVIEEHETESHLCYFPTGKVEHGEREALASAKGAGARGVLTAVARRPDASMSEIAEQVDRSLSTVSHHVSRLKDVGVLEVRREGSEKRIRLTSLGEEVVGYLRED